MNCYLLILFVYKTQLLYHRGRLFRVSQNLRQFYTRKSYFAIKKFHTRIDTGHNFCELITLRYANVTVFGMKKCEFNSRQ